MAFEYQIVFHEAVSYELVLEELLTACHRHQLTARAFVEDNQLVLPDDSSWGRWLELSEDQNGLYFWVTASQREQEEVISIIEKAMADMGLSKYQIIDCED